MVVILTKPSEDDTVTIAYASEQVTFLVRRNLTKA
jgi:hypothetical protein